MATTIKLKNGSGAPLAGDLVQGEPAFDLTNKRLYTEDSGGTVIEVGTNPSTLTVDTDTLAVDATNNRVGIGTTSPTSTASAGPTLEISGTAGGNLVLSDSNATSGQRAKYLLSQGGALYVGHSADDGTSPVNDLVINSSGNVGIGTASPSSLLDVSSGTNTDGTDVTITVGGTSANTRQSLITKKIQASDRALEFYAASGGSSEDIRFFRDNANETMRIDSSGNVGIGTTSPTFGSGSGLEVERSGSATVRVERTGATAASGEFFAGNGKVVIGSTSNTHLEFRTNSTENMRIDSSGNVGIGTTSPSAVISSSKIVQVGSGGNTTLSVTSTDSVNDRSAILELLSSGNGTSQSIILYGDTDTSPSTPSPLVFQGYHSGARTERMRLDASGNLLVGKTTTALTTAGVALLPNGELYVTRDSGATAYFNREGSDGDVIVIRNDNVTVGSISVSGSTTSYNPSSDVRLKENIRDYDNALADVMKLKPRKYSWKTDGAEDSGFIAQELMETPEFANRVNPIDDDSDDPMYGVDYMKFVAVLTGAIQEQQAMIETLQAEVAALKGA